MGRLQTGPDRRPKLGEQVQSCQHGRNGPMWSIRATGVNFLEAFLPSAPGITFFPPPLRKTGNLCGP